MISITHATQSAIIDDAVPGEIGPSEWNATHVLSGLGVNVPEFLAAPTSTNLAAAVTDETGTGALVFATSPTFNNGTVTLTPTSAGAALRQGFAVSQSFMGTSSVDFVGNNISISADNSDVGANALYGFSVGHTFGGTSTKGNRAAILGFINLNAATAAANTQRNYVAGDFIAQASSGDGGTGVTSATGKGQIFGVGGSVNITAGTNFLNVTGAEFGTVMAAGTSVWYKSLMQAVGGLGDTVKGSGVDAMAVFSNQSNTALWDDGILIAAPNGYWPIKSTGTIFRTADAGTATNGIDISNTTFTGKSFKANGFSINPNGGGNFGGLTTISAATPFFNALLMESTAADANGGPYLLFRRTSASPAANDVGGTMIWQFQNSTPTQFNGAALQAVLVDPTAGSEDVALQYTTSVNGANNTNVMQVYQGLAVGDTMDPGLGAIGATSSIKSKSATAGIGYGTGAGGTVTQITSRTTGVTLNTVCGEITLFSQVNSAVSGATAQTFTVTNSTVAAADMVHVCQKSGTDKYLTFVTNVSAGSFQITNFTTGGTTNEAPKFAFTVEKAVTS